MSVFGQLVNNRRFFSKPEDLFFDIQGNLGKHLKPFDHALAWPWLGLGCFRGFQSWWKSCRAIYISFIFDLLNVYLDWVGLLLARWFVVSDEGWEVVTPPPVLIAAISLEILPPPGPQIPRKHLHTKKRWNASNSPPPANMCSHQNLESRINTASPLSFDGSLVFLPSLISSMMI